MSKRSTDRKNRTENTQQPSIRQTDKSAERTRSQILRSPSRYFDIITERRDIDRIMDRLSNL
jgi:hypothetical protein